MKLILNRFASSMEYSLFVNDQRSDKKKNRNKIHRGDLILECEEREIERGFICLRDNFGIVPLEQEPGGSHSHH